jgi:hypothetical protein
MNHNIRNHENILEFNQYIITNSVQFSFNYFSLKWLTQNLGITGGRIMVG